MVGKPSEDMLQEGYRQQWGVEGRNDLGVMSALGANAVRVYHSLGLGVKKDHGGFLDRAQSLRLNVMPGYHTEMAHYAECPAFDCFDSWKNATLEGFKYGFKKQDSWHPAVAVLILLNEPDFFDAQPKCQPSGPWCRVKASLSALDGVLAAEREAGVMNSSVKFTVTWSFAMRASIDGKVTGPGIFGFQDMVAGIKDPSVAHYTPRSSPEQLQEAFETRWVNSLNTQAPWGFLNALVSNNYAQFEPTPWFIGEYGGNGQSKKTIRGDLVSMQDVANQGGSFIGAAFFQFQTTYWKGGAEMNFGLFALGKEQLGNIEEVCDGASCRAWPVHCLTTDLKWLPGSMALRAMAVADAWGGSIHRSSLCGGRRLTEEVGTRLACRVRKGGDQSAAVGAALNRESFGKQLAAITMAVLGSGSAAVRGDLRLQHAVATKVASSGMPIQDWGWGVWAVLSGVLLLLLGMSLAIFCVCRRRKPQPTQRYGEATGAAAV